MSSTSTTISQRTFRVSRISDFGGVLMLVTLPSSSHDPVPVIWDKIGAPDAAADTLAMCRNLRPKSAGYWEMEADFVSFPRPEPVHAAGDSLTVSGLVPLTRPADRGLRRPRLARTRPP